VASGSYTISPRAVNASVPSYAASTSALYAVVGSGGQGTFTDAFNRADAGDLGGSWTTVSGAPMIQGRQLRTAPTRGLHTAVVSGLAGATPRASASFAMEANSGGPRFGLVLRYQDANNHYACYRQTGGTSILRIVKVVNGVEHVLKASPVANPASNTPSTLGCRAESATLSLDVNGGARISVSDSSFATGKVGVQLGYAAAGGQSVSLRADDFSATTP
jgi:hypothetical protein